MRADGKNSINNISFGAKVIFKERKRKKFRNQISPYERKVLTQQLNKLKRNEEIDTLTIKVLKEHNIVHLIKDTSVPTKHLKYNIMATLTDKSGCSSTIRLNRLKANEIKPEDIYEIIKKTTVNIFTKKNNFFYLNQVNNTKKSTQTTLDRFC